MNWIKRNVDEEVGPSEGGRNSERVLLYAGEGSFSVIARRLFFILSGIHPFNPFLSFPNLWSSWLWFKTVMAYPSAMDRHSSENSGKSLGIRDRIDD